MEKSWIPVKVLSYKIQKQYLFINILHIYGFFMIIYIYIYILKFLLKFWSTSDSPQYSIGND